MKKTRYPLILLLVMVNIAFLMDLGNRTLHMTNWYFGLFMLCYVLILLNQIRRKQYIESGLIGVAIALVSYKFFIA